MKTFTCTVGPVSAIMVSTHARHADETKKGFDANLRGYGVVNKELS